MRKDKYNNKTFRRLPGYKEINWFIDVKESQLFYKKYQKKKVRRQMKKEDFNFCAKDKLKEYAKKAGRGKRKEIPKR